MYAANHILTNIKNKHIHITFTTFFSDLVLSSVSLLPTSLTAVPTLSALRCSSRLLMTCSSQRSLICSSSTLCLAVGTQLRVLEVSLSVNYSEVAYMYSVLNVSFS